MRGEGRGRPKLRSKGTGPERVCIPLRSFFVTKGWGDGRKLEKTPSQRLETDCNFPASCNDDVEGKGKGGNEEREEKKSKCVFKWENTINTCSRYLYPPLEGDSEGFPPTKGQ